ncbi:MAG: PDDEXK nuclease domain-containing protein [Candidatus Parvarchaeota archaeon]|nr:PDDEXK nuclease domain-containing protein [Candidatus Jingweiarchaeum tengchongense]
MKLTRKGLGIQKPEYIIKDFYVLEFIGLKEKTKLREADLEKALIEHLKEFLLELVRGLHSQPARNAIPLMENIFGLPLYFTIPFFSAMSS